MRKVLFLVLAVLFVVGCASDKSIIKVDPEGLMVDVLAQNAGYWTAKENRDIGEVALKLCDVKDLTFETWSNRLVDLFVDDEFLAMNFTKLLTAVKIDIEVLDKLEDRLAVYSKVRESFCFGLGKGLK